MTPKKASMKLLVAVLIAVFALVLPVQAEDVLKLYTHNEPTEMEQWVPEAEKVIGMKIEWVRLSSNELWSRIEAEAPNFHADMIWGFLNSDAQVGTMKGYFIPYISKQWADIPDKFKDPDGYWYGYNYWFSLGIVNKDLLAQKSLPMPASWVDLTNPVYKGEIVMPNPGTSGTAFIFVSAIMQIFGEEKGWEIMEGLDKNAGQYTSSGSKPAQLVAQGEYAVGISWDQAVYSHIEKGFPVEAFIPKEGTAFDLEAVAILKNAKNIEGAQKLIDWLGSPEGQAYIGTFRSKVTRPGVEGTIKIDPNLINYDALWAGENKKRIMAEWKERFKK